LRLEIGRDGKKVEGFWHKLWPLTHMAAGRGCYGKGKYLLGFRASLLGMGGLENLAVKKRGPFPGA